MQQCFGRRMIVARTANGTRAALEKQAGKVDMKPSKLICRMIVVVSIVSLGACASLPENKDRSESYAYDNTHETPD